MRFRYVDSFYVGVHTAQQPTLEAWRAHCLDVERYRQQTRGVLVYTEGGGPDSRQRQELRDALHDVRAPPTAILTASPLVRGIVTGLNWFLRGQSVAAYSPSDIERALDYLGRGKELPREVLLRTLLDLADELGVKLPFLAKISYTAAATTAKYGVR